MHSAHEFLKALTMVLCVAAVTTVLFQRLRQPVVLGYILAGLIIGPHVPIPLVANQEIVQTLSELGVILLMFSLGLEFSMGKLVKVGPTAGLTAIIQSSVMVWLGFMAGRALGWTVPESIVAGCIIAISSTTIIAKAFDEQGIKGKLRELVVGILIVEDLIAILLMAALTAFSTGSGLSAGALAMSMGRLAAFLIGLVAIGMLVVPRTVRAIVRLKRPETTLVSSIGLCFGIALLAQEFGYSVALGAFLAGSLIAESGEEQQIEHLVQPVRDMFAAIFFVSVGLLIDPALIARHWVAIAVLSVLVIAGKILSVSLGAFLTGNRVQTSIQAGMSLAQIGEFSFIIAGLGLSLKVTGDFLYPVAVAVSALTTLTTPWLIRASVPVANWVDRKLPHSLQTFVALYANWIEQLRSAPGVQTAGATARRLVWLLFLDVGLLSALVIGTALANDQIVSFGTRITGMTEPAVQTLIIGAAAGLSIPFCIGVVQIVRRLGLVLATLVLPEVAAGQMDPAAAPRRALIVTMQLAIVLLVGIPFVAVTQPFLPLPSVLVLMLPLIVLGVVFWRSAANLHGHVRAGAQMIVEVLAAQSHAREGGGAHSLAQVNQLFPGLGEPVPVELEARSRAVGKTLAQLNLRGVTGATVLAISRDHEGIHIPTATTVLQRGDILALAGSHEAVEAARGLLTGTDEPDPVAPQ